MNKRQSADVTPAQVGIAVGALLGGTVASTRAVLGGDINRAYEVRLADGQPLFVKTSHQAPAGMFTEEARGLRWLAEAEALRTPTVVAVSEAPVPLLVLQWLEAVTPTAAAWEAFGRKLADLHASRAPSFGTLPDNFIGTLNQSNRKRSSWREFFWQQRLTPQVRIAVDSRVAPASWSRRFEVLRQRHFDSLVEPDYPERLHGDLWGGNVMFVRGGTPYLVDPAAYAGHGEVDLAMMRLFGGFDERAFAAYVEQRPVMPDLSLRLNLYQLYPLLVHVNLFGKGYVGQVDERLRELTR